MNHSRPLNALAHGADPWPRRSRRVDAVLRGDDGTRWRSRFASDRAAPAGDFAGDDGDARSVDFLRVLPEQDARTEEPREASLLSYVFSMRALQSAVIANGGALAALALLMVAPENGPKAGLMASAVVLGLGLMFAAISVVASQIVPLKLARIAAPSRFTMISGAVSYAALALAAVPLI